MDTILQSDNICLHGTEIFLDIQDYYINRKRSMFA